LVALLNWSQHELWRLCLDAPQELRGFALHVRYLFSPGFTAETGVRIRLETASSFNEIERKIQEKTSESSVVQIVNLELKRLTNFVDSLGLSSKVNSANHANQLIFSYRNFPEKQLMNPIKPSGRDEQLTK
jgi:hypothetical protein